MEGEQGSSERAHIENYLKLYCLEECLDESLNEIVEKRPANPYMMIANFMETKTLPEILDVRLVSVLVGRGLVGVQANVTTNITTFSAVAQFPYSYALESDMLREFAVLQDRAQQALKGQDPRNVPQIDELISVITGIEAPVGLALSMACCRAGARHKAIPLFKFISELAGSSPCMPMPVVTVLTRQGGGSMNIGQFITVTPTTPSFFEGAMESVLRATQSINKAIDANKTSGAAMTVMDGGAPCSLASSIDEAVQVFYYIFHRLIHVILLNTKLM